MKIIQWEKKNVISILMLQENGRKGQHDSMVSKEKIEEAVVKIITEIKIMTERPDWEKLEADW